MVVAAEKTQHDALQATSTNTIPMDELQKREAVLSKIEFAGNREVKSTQGNVVSLSQSLQASTVGSVV